MKLPEKISVSLTRYIDNSGERPLVMGTDIPVATIAYRVMSGSWGLGELCYQFSLEEAPIMAALLYYNQFQQQIDEQEGDRRLEFEAMD